MKYLVKIDNYVIEVEPHNVIKILDNIIYFNYKNNTLKGIIIKIIL